MLQRITPDQLRLGMFVHLGVGWMSHPFPLSSFKITNGEQLAQIRALNLRTLQWDAERSDAPLEPALVGAVVAMPAALMPEQGGGVDVAEVEVPALDQPQAPSEPAFHSPAAQLDRQLHTLRLCEAQFGLACRDARAINERVLTHPDQARAGAAALTDALLGKMLGEHGVSLRVLGEPTGDRLAAHGVNVAVLSLLLGRHLGLDAARMQDMGVGALLHDAGKLEMPQHLRHVHPEFTAREVDAYRSHVQRGVERGRRMGLSSGALLVVAQHHEHADGSGFPQGLAVPEALIGARIVALVNAFDGLCQGAKGAAMTPHEALSHLFLNAKPHFGEALITAFVQMMGIYPPGSVVQLSDERYGMVMTVNSDRPLKPQVLVHEAQDAPHDAASSLHLDLAAHPHLSVKRSLKPQQLPPRVAQFLAPRRRVAYFFDADAPLPASAVAA